MIKILNGYKGFAVECQCSSISVSEYAERNQVYESLKLKPIWILGEYYQSSRKLVQQIIDDYKFSSFYLENKFYTFNGKNSRDSSLKDIIKRTVYIARAHAKREEKNS